MPIEPLAVESGDYSGVAMVRPAPITAMGVISIVVASLSIVASVAGAMTGLGMMMTLAIASAVGSTSTSVSIAGSAAGPDIAQDANPQAMSADKRLIVIDAFQRIRSLSETRQRQLDALLAEHGRDIFDQPEESLNATDVSAEISDSGHLQTASGAGNGPEFFVLGNGRLEISDDHAVFFPSDGKPALRSSAATTEEESETGDFTPTVGTATLSNAQIHAVLTRISHLGARLNPQQQKTIRQMLKGPAQQLINRTGGGAEAAAQILTAMSFPDGSAMIQARYGPTVSTLMLDSAGQVTNSTTTNSAVPTRTAIRKVNLRWVFIALASSAANLGVAIFLLVAGILVLRQSRRGATLHWIYAALKIPLVVLATVAAAEVGYLFFSSMPSAGPARSTFPAATIMAAPAILGLIYPIALLFILRSRSVRGYYAAV